MSSISGNRLNPSEPKQQAHAAAQPVPPASKDIDETRFAQLPPQMVAQPYWAGSEDDVSLVDIALVVLRHKRLLYLTAITLICLGGLAIFLLPDTYRYAVVIETGTYVLPDEHGNLGERKLIEPVAHTKSKLETSIIPQVRLSAFSDQLIDQPDGISAETDPQSKAVALSEIRDDSSLSRLLMTVTVPSGSNLIEISAEAPLSLDEKVRSLLSQVAEQVAIDHKTKSRDVLEALRQQIEQMKINVEELTAQLEDQQRSQEVTAQLLASLADERKLIEAQVARVNVELTQLQQSRAAYLKNIDEPKEALTLLLVDNQINQVAMQKDSLEQQLYIELGQEQASLESRYKSQGAQINITRAELTRAEQLYQRFSSDETSQSQLLSAASSPLAVESPTPSVPGQSLQASAKNIFPTTLAVEPYRSRDPQGIGQSVKLVALVIISLLVALFMTFMAEFVRRVSYAGQGD